MLTGVVCMSLLNDIGFVTGKKTSNNNVRKSIKRPTPSQVLPVYTRRHGNQPTIDIIVLFPFIVKSTN